jgi:hypothetical protein
MATNLLRLAIGTSILVTLSYQVFTGALLDWSLTWTPTFYLFNLVTISVSISISSLFAFLWLFDLFTKFKLIKGIPVVPNNSIFGFIDPFIPLKGDAHFRMLDIANKFGKLAQFTFLGHHIVMINDGSLAKQALLGVSGKGYFHVIE